MHALRLPDWSEDVIGHGVGGRYLRENYAPRPRFVADDNRIFRATRDASDLVAVIEPDLPDAQELAEQIADALNRRR